MLQNEERKNPFYWYTELGVAEQRQIIKEQFVRVVENFQAWLGYVAPLSLLCCYGTAKPCSVNFAQIYTEEIFGTLHLITNTNQKLQKIFST